jgi:hypothetical protein
MVKGYYPVILKEVVRSLLMKTAKKAAIYQNLKGTPPKEKADGLPSSPHRPHPGRNAPPDPWVVGSPPGDPPSSPPSMTQ